MNRIAERVLGIKVAAGLMTVVFAGASAAAQTSGPIVAWGNNGHGELNVPAPNSGFVAIAAGSAFSLGLKSDGSIVAWGFNWAGQTDVPAPNSGFIAIAAGQEFSLGLKNDGSIAAWGYNEYGQCNVPAPNSGFIAIAAGDSWGLGLKSDGSIRVWGLNNAGQSNVPAPNSGFMAIDGGGGHNLGLKNDGSIMAWGSNFYGQCNVPVPNSAFSAVAAGLLHSLGLKNDGSILAWGRNDFGQCDVPAPNSGFIAVAAHGSHCLGLKSDGSIVAWGRNDFGQCNVPAPNSGFTAIAGGYVHSLGLRPPVLSLNPVSVCNTGTQVIVKIRMAGQSDLIVGGQFFLQYDQTRLDFVSAVPGALPFTEEIFESVNETLGTIDYAVGVLAPLPGVMADTDMVTLTFDRIGDTCSTANLVSFRTHSPPTQLTNIFAEAIATLNNNLPAITIDSTPPVISPAASNMLVECDGAGNTASLNAWLASHGGASASDNCSAVVWTHNFTALSDLCGATGAATVQFTATDGCGNFSTTSATFTIQDTIGPVFNQSCPRPTIVVNAGAGGCTAMASTVNAIAPTATDACSGSASVVGTRSDSQLLTAPYPSGNTTITWRATDACGNFSDCFQTITVNAFNEIAVNLELPGVWATAGALNISRCIAFEVHDCGGGSVAIDQVVNFSSTGPGVPAFGSATLLVPCGGGAPYDCITARDRLHTLRRSADSVDLNFGIVGTQYVALFTVAGSNALIGGNLTDDAWIDILDFGYFVGQYGITYPGAGSTTCATLAPHADISGNGLVSGADFTFIQINFLQARENNCCLLPSRMGAGGGGGGGGGGGSGDGGNGGPVTRISVKELIRRGMKPAAAGDVNRDGWLDANDINVFFGGG